MSTQEAVALKLAERYLRDAIPADLLDGLKHYFNQADAKLKDTSLYRAWLNKIQLIPASQSLQIKKLTLTTKVSHRISPAMRSIQTYLAIPLS